MSKIDRLKIVKQNFFLQSLEKVGHRELDYSHFNRLNFIFVFARNRTFSAHTHVLPW